MGDKDYVTLVAALPAPDKAPAVHIILQYSLDAALLPYRPLFLLLISLALVGLTLLVGRRENAL